MTTTEIAVDRTTSDARTLTPAERAQLTDLVSHLGASLDEHRFEALRELFTDDATATTPGGTAEGRDAVINQATRNHVGFERLHHVMTNVLVQPDPAVEGAPRTASIRANLIAHFAHADGVPVLALGAIYRLGARETDAGWRIADLRVTPVWRTAAA
ncbi:nuclear transport factor 2 family protein [Agromyces sp. MMS24-K17]|uniref:nuclear transport factor 2 family protein n=1 Tax=Agromyces sp. MMS24-K17 TaxID=3372850 RepID=UPI003755189B